MAIIKKKEMKALGKNDIEKKMGEIKLELAKDRASAFVGGSVKNPGRIREMKRTVARMKTILKSQEAVKKPTE
jgi:large subunit ribosomal protein L29